MENSQYNSYDNNDRSMGSDDTRTWAILAHLSAPASMIFSAGWLGFLGPFIIWLVFKDRSTLVRAASARSFNYSVALLVLSIVAWICFFTLILIPVAIVLWVVAFILVLWHPIKAAFAASRGEIYKYPFQIGILR
ncbi:MAG: DUF4870 domain-containing protein [Flaviflexus sp.]|nr:DUF4870 domain-containing protein [Flaviflexus ciconiae]